MINFLSKFKYAYIFSGTLVVASLVLLFTLGLKTGIDFTGGTLMEIGFNESLPSNRDLQKTLESLNLKSLTLQASENKSVLIRYAAEDDELNQQVMEMINKDYPETIQLRADFINSTVSKELKRKSIQAIIWAIFGILAYIAWAFRKVSRPVESWKYGLGAIFALVHDIAITVGIFTILGHYWGLEVGIPFVAALLTILGYSVNDTIVVYDRTRENIIRSSQKEKFPEIVNRSLNETLGRSINTSLTVIITLLAIYFFGGESIKDFSLALIIGIVFGTYSSIFVATALLVTSYKLQLKNKN
ncbi:MAG: protein translocase subunit SecF [Candidatus Moranbacteria bacterium CG10_big_fil_rev_8_21_14_0_10_35_21]|nr:MAG: protein translocase subunit SecF [Candidatus Moranbacteria bacterium CG10_big_fil_rev_8_21_14_0_10_35_21]PJA88684.1 MAG: protein translocase subunit SecF [Candidatus Moranbacteria bacterium CG_4_9_14_3_um_filter_36_9]